ncbi:MAG: methionyl-tRNA formyltransferase [Planctomycetota bacterium]|jgi:methionyl-tRNA formyltransferase
MRLVLMGTGPFGVPTFRRLYAGRHEIVAVVTAPVRPARGRGPAPAHPVRDLAAEHTTPVLDPENVNDEAARAALARLEADLLVVCDYGQILSAETLATARLGGVNLHGSLLPRYRGAAPVAWAIYHGETETGVSVIHMTPAIDAGPVIAQGRAPIGEDETAEDVELRLAELGGELMPEAIDDLEAGRAEAISQDSALVSKAPRLRKEHGLIDWTRPARAVKDQVRAMQPWPKAYTFWHRVGGEPQRLVVGPVTVETPEGLAAPGTVLEASGDRLLVAAGEGACLLAKVQPAGKRMMTTEEFLRGHRVRAGDLLGRDS